MKKSILLLMLLYLSVLFAQTRPVSLLDAQKIADANAKVLWGDKLSSAEPIPYYGFDDKIIAWCFNYAIDKPFPPRESLKQMNEDALKSDNRDLSWGVGEFGYLIIGASRSMPVFVEYSKSLSTDYALSTNLDKAALKAFPKGYELVNTYYLGAASIWNCVTDGTEKRYINLLSKPMTLTEDEFRQMLRERKNSWLDNDFTDEWTDFLDNNMTLNLTRDVAMIPGESDMPFYEWSYGCVPCAATTVLAWWDNYHKLGKLIDYHGSRWDPIVETYRHHVPQLLPIMADRMETGYESGNTDPWDVNDGLEDAAASQGYTVDCEGSWGLFSDWHFFHGIIDYINNQTPGLATIDPGWLDYHTVAAVGYNMSPNQVFVHDSNHPALTTYSYSILECYWYVYPELTQTNGVKIISPNGGTQWGGNGGDNEVLTSGDFYEINWASYTEVDSTYVKLYYNDEGGGAAERWFPITTFTANDGHYDWLVPSINCIYGTSTDYARIKIELYNAATNQIISQDGSFGNFTINAGGSLAQLSATPADVQISPDYYSADSYEEDTWYAIGVANSGTLSEDFWKIELFDDIDFANKIDEIYHWDTVNYVMVDNHHIAPAERGVKFRSNNSQQTSFAKAQLVGDPSMELSFGTTGTLSWSSDNVIRIWNVYLSPGDYYFELNIAGTVADLDIALFKWGGDGIFSSEESVASSINVGGGGRESFHYSPFVEGYYGLCVSSRTHVTTTYTITLANAGVWDGSASSSWFNPANWTSNSVPTFNHDVIIPAGCPHYPTITGGAGNPAYVKTLTIESGGKVYLNDAYLNVYGDMHIAGNLRLLNNNDVIDVTGNVVWESGSTALSQEFSTINCYQNWTFRAGSLVQLDAGNVVFISDQSTYIVCDSPDSYFHNLKINKLSGALAKFHETSDADLIMSGDLNIYSGSVFSSNSLRSIVINDLFISNGNFQFDAGTVKFTGTNAYLECSASDYFYNVEINTSGVTALLSNLYLHGDMVINSGGILATTYTIYIGGSWYNNMGSAAFNKGTSTVVFNSNDQAEVVNGSFYTMEINNANCELHFDQGVSTCDRYDWTAGVLYIDGGTLTINDLVDNGIYGRTYVHSGLLNVTQDSYQTVYLNGELHISGGIMNVTGGTNYSYWPGSTHSWLEMSGGTLDFKTVGINIVTGSYLLTADITGGLIRTVGNIACSRIDFQPQGGTFEMYGSADKAINFVSQSNLPSLIINKQSTREDNTVNSFIATDAREDNIRTNAVSLSSNLNLTGDLVISAGTLNLNGHTLSTLSAADIYGNLTMSNALDVLNVGTSISWYNGQSSTITAGTINVNQDWTNESEVTLQLGTSNTVNFIGEESSTLYLDAGGMYFGNIVVNKTVGITEIYTGTQYLNISGNLTVSQADTLYFRNATAQIGNAFNLDGIVTLESGCSVTTYDLNLTGNVTINNGILTVSHNCTELSTGVLSIYSGSFILDRAYTGNFFNFGGGVNVYGGVLQITNDGIQFGTDSNYYMDGGTLKVGWNFKATNTDVFQTDGGIVEFIGARTATLECNNGNYFTNVVFNKPSTSYPISFLTDVSVNNDLTVQGGNPTLSGHTLSVYRDVNIIGGRLTANNATDIINVGRNWSNTVGTNGFIETNSTVNFITSQVATISNETFNIVYINKTSTEQNDIVINSNAVMTTTGWLYIVQGCLKLDSNSILDANSNISIMDGGGLSLASDGALNTLRLAGHLYDQNVEYGNGIGFNAISECNVILDGSADQNLRADNYSIMQFYNITINKAAGKVKPYNNITTQGDFRIISGEWSYAIAGKTKYFSRNLTIDATGIFSDSTGTTYYEGLNDSNLNISGVAKFGIFTLNKSTAYTLYISGNSTFAGTTGINLTAGTLNLNGYSLKYKGTMNIGTDGKLYLTGGSILNINDSSTLSVGSGGEFVSLGVNGNPAKLTSDTGYYAFNTTSLSSVAVDYTIFEKMNTNGINLASRCIVDPEHSFNRCTFQNGQEAGTLLKVNCQTAIAINGAVFPANTWGGLYNVSRTSALGSVTFSNYSGAFSGPDYDYTTNNSIIWEAIAPPATPANFRISYNGNAAVLTWDAVPGVTGYRIYRALSYEDLDEAEEVGNTDMTTWGDESITLYPKAFYFINAFIE